MNMTRAIPMIFLLSAATPFGASQANTCMELQQQQQQLANAIPREEAMSESAYRSCMDLLDEKIALKVGLDPEHCNEKHSEGDAHIAELRQKLDMIKMDMQVQKCH